MTQNSDSRPLVSIRNLTAGSASRVLIKGLDLDIPKGDLLGIAGESGSGKTMLIRCLLNILPEDVECHADQFTMFGTDCQHLPESGWLRLIGSHVGFVPQNTVSYLHPMMKIKKQIIDNFISFKKGTKAEALKRASDLLLQVGLEDPDRILNSYEWELSGGMRQRVNIAMALMNEPDLLIADEPTTALDAVIQRQIMDLFMKIHDETGIAMIIISHDLNMLRHYSKRSLVMYAGRMVEIGDTQTLFKTPAHPYTKALMKVIPTLSCQERLPEIPGYVPDSGRETDSCIFAPRCPNAEARCREAVSMIDLGEGHYSLCVLAESDSDTQNGFAAPGDLASQGGIADE